LIRLPGLVEAPVPLSPKPEPLSLLKYATPSLPPASEI
jgi:hypothetical protein